MSGMGVLDIAHVGSSNNNFLLDFIEENFPVQRDSLLDSKVPLVESTLMGRKTLHFVEKRFKSLNSVFLAVLCLFLLGWIGFLDSLFSVLLDALEGLFDHMRSVKLY